MRLAQSGVRRRQDSRHDGPVAARDRSCRSARVGDVPTISAAGGLAGTSRSRRAERRRAWAKAQVPILQLHVAGASPVCRVDVLRRVGGRQRAARLSKPPAEPSCSLIANLRIFYTRVYTRGEQAGIDVAYICATRVYMPPARRAPSPGQSGSPTPPGTTLGPQPRRSACCWCEVSSATPRTWSQGCARDSRESPESGDASHLVTGHP